MNNLSLSVKDPKSFDNKSSITGKLEGIDEAKNVATYVLLNQLSNFWRTPDIPLINCEVSLTSTWLENYLLVRS